MPSSHDAVLARVETLYKMLFAHSGYGEMQIEIRYLRKHEKEVLIRCGKQYRFVVPFTCTHDGDCEGDCNGECGDDCQCITGDDASAGSRGGNRKRGRGVRKGH